MKKIQKILTSTLIIFTLISLLLLRSVAVYADDTSMPTPPPQPTAPSAPTQPVSTPPTAPSTPTLNTPTTSSPTSSPSLSTSTTTDTSLSPTPSTSPSSQATTPSNPGTTSPNETSSNSSEPSSAGTTTSSGQQNSGQATAGITQASTTGNNTSSDTVGNASLHTADANSSGTLLHEVNTNLNNVSVSEFTVAGDHTGDIVLDFPTNCILNCGIPTTSTNSTTGGNGALSTNTTTTNQSASNSTNQNNAAGIGNTLTLKANSGNNATSQNTSGDSAIVTGNANVDANSLAFANNNIDGKIDFGVVNIYGNLTGDILLPQSTLNASCPTCSTSTMTTGNGAGSTNTTAQNTSASTTNNQANGATITNNIKTSATTGDNSTTENTSGNNGIQAGSSAVDANSLTLANNNLDGGTWWLVLINNKGNWSGQLIGGNGNIAASPGLAFNLNPQGNIATTSNGAGSTNTTTVTDNTANTDNQTNTTSLTNTLDLTANTGGNHADQNTGGTSTVTTGNSNIMANLVDFVNNNLTHGAHLIVTIVNVFGSWVGDFVTPGHTKQSITNPQQINSDTSNTAIPSSNTQDIPTPMPQDNIFSYLPSINTITPQQFIQWPSSSTSETPSVVLAANTHSTDNTTHLAGIQYPQEAQKNAARAIQINLAWLVIILPALALANLLRKQLLRFRK